MSVTAFNSKSTKYVDNGENNFIGGLNTEGNISSQNHMQVSKIKNLDINGRYLKPRAGLDLISDISKWLDFDKIIKYDVMESNHSYIPPASRITSLILATNITVNGMYSLNSSLLNFDVIEIVIDNVSFLLSNFEATSITRLTSSFNISGKPVGVEIGFKTNKDFITVNNITGTLQFVRGINISSADDITINYNNYSIGEYVVYTKDTNTYVVGRYGEKVDEDNIMYSTEISPTLISTKILEPNDVYTVVDKFYLLNYEGGVQISYVDISNDKLVLNFDNILLEDSRLREDGDITSFSVHGQNLLSPIPDIEIKDKSGPVINIDNIFITGADNENKNRPFRLDKMLKLDAFITTTATVPIENISYRWSYDYMGPNYALQNTTDTSVVKGKIDIDKTWDAANREHEFTPHSSGFYRFYLSIKTPADADKKEEDLPVTQRSLIDIEVNDSNKSQLKGLIIHESIVKGCIVRKYRNYYIYVGSDSSSFGNTLFLSVPADPLKVPIGFMLSLDANEHIVDIIDFREQLLIFTDKNIYRLDGDAPSVIVSRQSDTSSMKAFYLTKVFNNVGISNRKQVISTMSAIYVVTNEGYLKIAYTSGNILTSFIKSNNIKRILESKYDLMYNFANKVYMVKGNNILVHEILPYSQQIGDDCRFYNYELPVNIVDMYSKKGEVMLVSSEGKVCMFNDSNFGFDFGIPFECQVMTVANNFGFANVMKKFKEIIIQMSPNHKDNIILNRYVALDVWSDNFKMVDSNVQHINVVDGKMIFTNEKEGNVIIDTQGFVLDDSSTGIDYNASKVIDTYGAMKSRIGTTEVNNEYLQRITIRKQKKGICLQFQLTFNGPLIVKQVSTVVKNISVDGHKRTRLGGRYGQR